MFNNKFNSSKNDPLVEAVKAAQAEGNMRRQAEAQVNEAFGVFSRRAVVREDLAAYDAALEEAYKCMKEGEKWEGSKEDKDEDKKLAKKHGMSMKQWEKSDADKKHDKKEKCDEAKLADKDYDKDGKIESPKDEVWGSRLRAAKLSGKLKEGSMDSDVVGGGAVTKDNKPVVSSTAPKADTSGPSASEKSALTSKISAMKEAKLDEISAKLATRYTKKSFKDMKQAADFGDTMSIRNRAKGIETASKKLTGGAKVQANEEMKASILNKLVEKFEGSSFKAAQVTGKSVNEGQIPSMDFGVTRDGTIHPGGKPGLASRAFNAVKGVVAKAAPVVAKAAIKAAPAVAKVAPYAGLASMAISPESGKTMSANYNAGHNGIIPHPTTPGVKASDSFARMRQMGTATPKPAAAPSTGTPKPAAVPTPAPKPAAAVSTAPVPAPKATPASAPKPADVTTNKSGFYKGGSQGDYTIKKGDTLSGIAKRTGQSVSDLASMNKISDVNKISTGAKLATKVPTPPSRPADVSSAPTSASKPAEPAATSSAPAPMMTNFKPSGPIGDIPKMSDQSPSSVSNPKPAAPAPEPKKKDAGTSSAPAPVAECVQIGANKYRIV